MAAPGQHVRIGLIVEDQYSDPYRVIIQKIHPDKVRGYPLRKNRSIPATRKLRAWIEQVKDKYDFVIVLVDLDTPMHHKDPNYFRNLQQICEEEGAALLIVKIELESWLLADAGSIARLIELNGDTLSRNSSLKCFYDLVMGCCGENGKEYFEAYPQEAHCHSPEFL